MPLRTYGTPALCIFYVTFAFQAHIQGRGGRPLWEDHVSWDSRTMWRQPYKGGFAPVTWALGQMSSWHPPAFPATTGTTKRALYEQLCGQESVLEECFGASRRKAYPGEFSMVVGYDIATRNDTYVEAFQSWSPGTCLDNREQNSVRTGAPAAAFETKQFATPLSSEFYGAPVYDS